MARTKKTEVTTVDFKAVAEKLQAALSKEMIENQAYEKERAQLINEIARQTIIIQYLESKFR
jgi:hypothetical protein